MAWLITWEDFGHKGWGLNKRRVVTFLPPRLTKRDVKKIVVALWCAEAELTLSERMGFALSLEQRFLYEEGDEFYYGLKPFLHARKVSNLRATEKDGLHTLSWTEPPVYRPESDSSTMVKLIRPEREASFCESEP
jgi:hypothetical protein